MISTFERLRDEDTVESDLVLFDLCIEQCMAWSPNTINLLVTNTYWLYFGYNTASTSDSSCNSYVNAVIARDGTNRQRHALPDFRMSVSSGRIRSANRSISRTGTL